MNALTINNGPFKGETFDASEGYQSVSDDGQVRINIAMARLTQRFLERFPPVDGWSVTINGEFLPMDMVPLPREGQVGAMQHVPSAKFIATLLNAQDRIVGQASTLWTIQGPTDWERGETNARQRLYEAMGLQSRFGEQQSEAVARPRGSSLATVSTIHAAPTKPVTVSPVIEEPVSRPAEEQPQPAAESVTDPVTGPAATEPSTTEPAASKPRGRGKAKQEAAAAPAASVDQASAEPAPATESAGNTATQAESTTDEAPTQGGMDLGESDPQQQPPPAAMLTQINRLAQLLQKEVPELATRADATAFLASLQGR